MNRRSFLKQYGGKMFDITTSGLFPESGDEALAGIARIYLLVRPKKANYALRNVQI